jgi:putative flavoprotein involved in K+ transport
VGPLYSEEALARGITTELAYLINISVPARAAPARHARVYEAIRARDAEFYRRLKASGFLFDLGEDGSGIHIKYIREGGGYYIDVGGSELIIDGRIKLKVGDVERMTERAVVTRDGTELPADLVVYATGYGSMNEWAAQLISEEVADKVGKCWGVGSGTDKDPGPWEGELRNMWRPTQQEALWFMGGNLFQARVFSLTLALQLKARFEGIPTPVYGLQEVFHRR